MFGKINIIAITTFCASVCTLLVAGYIGGFSGVRNKPSYYYLIMAYRPFILMAVFGLSALLFGFIFNKFSKSENKAVSSGVKSFSIGLYLILFIIFAIGLYLAYSCAGGNCS